MRYAGIMCLLLTPLMFGCENGLFGKSNPVTRFTYGPAGATFSDNKDNDIEVEGLTAEKSETGFKGGVAKVTIKNNASAVRKADVEQINALVNQQLAFNEGINAVGNLIAKLTPLVGQITSMLQANAVTTSGITGPFGIGATKNTGVAPTDNTAALDALKAQVAALEAKLSAATQPAAKTE